jgi:hypothetical protein
MNLAGGPKDKAELPAALNIIPKRVLGKLKSLVNNKEGKNHGFEL